MAGEGSSGSGLRCMACGKVGCNWAICGCDGYKEGCGSEIFDVDLLKGVVIPSSGAVVVEAEGGGACCGEDLDKCSYCLSVWDDDAFK